MKRTLSICLILVAIAALWCVRRPVHAQYRYWKGACLASLMQALDRTHWIDSPSAHASLPTIADLAGIQRYQAANRDLPPVVSGRVVFYGDSITDFWPTDYPAVFFPGKPYIGRGISGQSTPEMVWRFQPDVIALHPAAVVVLAGTNDVVLTERKITFQQTIENIQAMVQMAQRNHIRIILCSLLPVSHYPPAQQAAFSRRIRTINYWLQSYAASQHLTYVDYYAAMSDRAGDMKCSLSNDGLHPNAAGYAVMQQLAQRAIDTH